MEVLFTWKYGGNRVLVFGTFNNWNGDEMSKDSSGVWCLTKHLNRGAYEYKFKVDDQWCYDMEKLCLTDKEGHCNNVISIDFTIPTPFWWKLSGKKLELSGTFNNWRPQRMQHILVANDQLPQHYVEISLPLGFYQYKFVADDRWVYDDHQPHNYFDGVLNNFRQVHCGQLELYYHYSDNCHIGLQYLVYHPDGYTNGQNWPLILYLHSPKQKGDTVELIEEEGIPKVLKQGRSLPFIILSPQCPRNQKWSSLNTYLISLIYDFCNTHNVDRSRIYLTGVEMGAYGVWKLALENPHTFAAIAPFGGGGDVTKTKLITHLPVWATDNQFRSTFPDTKDMVDALIQVEGNVLFTVESSTERDCWSNAYAGENLYNWFLQNTNNRINN